MTTAAAVVVLSMMGRQTAEEKVSVDDTLHGRPPPSQIRYCTRWNDCLHTNVSRHVHVDNVDMSRF